MATVALLIVAGMVTLMSAPAVALLSAPANAVALKRSALEYR